MKLILKKKTKFRVHDKDGKRRNYIIYTLNDEQILKQKYPFDEKGERGFDIRLHIENDYLLNGRIHQTRINPDIQETRKVSFPVSQTVLKKYGIKKDEVIFLSNHTIVEPYKGELYDADPNCEHEVVAQWSGVKCSKCSGWYCS
jgi:hypothetical protein